MLQIYIPVEDQQPVKNTHSLHANRILAYFRKIHIEAIILCIGCRNVTNEKALKSLSIKTFKAFSVTRAEWTNVYRAVQSP